MKFQYQYPLESLQPHFNKPFLPPTKNNLSLRTEFKTKVEDGAAMQAKVRRLQLGAALKEKALATLSKAETKHLRQLVNQKLNNTWSPDGKPGQSGEYCLQIFNTKAAKKVFDEVAQGMYGFKRRDPKSAGAFREKLKRLMFAARKQRDDKAKYRATRELERMQKREQELQREHEHEHEHNRALA